MRVLTILLSSIMVLPAGTCAARDLPAFPTIEVSYISAYDGSGNSVVLDDAWRERLEKDMLKNEFKFAVSLAVSRSQGNFPEAKQFIDSSISIKLVESPKRMYHIKLYSGIEEWVTPMGKEILSVYLDLRVKDYSHEFATNYILASARVVEPFSPQNIAARFDDQGLGMISSTPLDLQGYLQSNYGVSGASWILLDNGIARILVIREGRVSEVLALDGREINDEGIRSGMTDIRAEVKARIAVNGAHSKTDGIFAFINEVNAAAARRWPNVKLRMPWELPRANTYFGEGYRKKGWPVESK